MAAGAQVIDHPANATYDQTISHDEVDYEEHLRNHRIELARRLC